MIEIYKIDHDVRGTDALIRRGIAGAIVLGLVGVLLLGWGKGVFADEIAVTAVIDDAGGSLTAGSDVKSRGVIVGKVTRIDRVDGNALVRLRLAGEHAENIARNATARIIPATVFGTTAVELVPGTGQRGLADGARLRQAENGRTLELQDALDSTQRVLSAVEPAELAATIGSLAMALEGRGTSLGESIETANRYLERLEPELDILATDIQLTALVLETLDASLPELLATLDNMGPTLRTLAAREKQVIALLRRATGVVDTSEAFVRAERRVLARSFRNTAAMLRAIYSERDQFAPGFLAFADFAELAAEGMQLGPFLDTDVFFKTGDDIPYTSADCPRYGPVAGDNCGGP